MTQTPPTFARNLAIERIRIAMVEKKITQAALADAAECHEKTIQNLMAGRSVRDQTLFDVCMVLDLDFDAVRAQWNQTAAPSSDTSFCETSGTDTNIAPIYMGGYTRDAVDHLIGRFLTVRRAFTTNNSIIAYRTDIDWDDRWPSLLFEEHNRPDVDYAHRGRVYVPPTSQFIHLVSLTKGAMRMIVLAQLDQTLQMRGLITTLSRRGADIRPVSTPIVYRKLSPHETPDLGVIVKGSESFAAYDELLSACLTEHYVSLITS
ncbi:MAG: helix-turn-helix transcriptional regulator [Hyphomicrobiaceae bacterium]